MNRLGLLAESDFRSLWVGETISELGTQISRLAIPYIATVSLRGTPFDVALLAAVQVLPFLLFTLPAGAWLDSVRRRPVMIAADLARLGALGTIPVAAVLGALSVAQLDLVAFVVGTATVLFDVAYQSYLPSLVRSDALIEGNGKLQASEAASLVIGPGLGGALISIVGAPLSVIADAASYVASALFVWRIRKVEALPRPVAHGPATGMVQQVKEGLAFVLGSRHLRAIAATTAAANLAGNVMGATVPVYLFRDLGLSAGTVGTVFALGAVGTLAGALLAGHVSRTLGVGPAAISAIALGGPAALLLPLAPHDGPLPWVVGWVGLTGASAVIYNVNQISYRQAVTPTAMQGRMNATMRFVVWGVLPIGSLAGGLLANAIGVHAAITVGAIGSCLPFLILALSPVRSLRAALSPEAA